MPDSTTNYSFNKPLVNNPTDADLWGGYLNANWDDADSIFNLRTQAYNFAGNDLDNARFVDMAEKHYSLGNISGAVAIDYENGHWQYGTVTGNITSVTVSNWPPGGSNAAWLTLEFVQDGTGSRTLALASAYKTAGGAGITLTTTAAARDLVHLTTRDGGTTILTRAELDFK